MTLPTEPIGRIPRPPELIQALQDFAAGRETAFAKIRARVHGTEMAFRELGHELDPSLHRGC